MLVTWEPSDIHGGQRVFIKGKPERYILGYRAGTCAGEPDSCLFISLADGGVLRSFATRPELCGLLNGILALPAEVEPVVTFND